MSEARFCGLFATQWTFNLRAINLFTTYTSFNANILQAAATIFMRFHPLTRIYTEVYCDFDLSSFYADENPFVLVNRPRCLAISFDSVVVWILTT